MAVSAAGLTIRKVLNCSPMQSNESSTVSAVGDSDDVDMPPPEKEMIVATYLKSRGKCYHLLNDLLGVVVLDLLLFLLVAF
jgi:hypothetical protein